MSLGPHPVANQASELLVADVDRECRPVGVDQRDWPPLGTTRTISATAAAGSTSHWSARSDRATSNEPSGSSRGTGIADGVNRTRSVRLGPWSVRRGPSSRTRRRRRPRQLRRHPWRARALPPRGRSPRRAAARQEPERVGPAPTTAAGVSPPMRRSCPWWRGARRRSGHRPLAGSRVGACPASPSATVDDLAVRERARGHATSPPRGRVAAVDRLGSITRQGASESEDGTKGRRWSPSRFPRTNTRCYAASFRRTTPAVRARS